MQLKKETIQELGEILKRNYHTELSKTDLEKLANSLVGYFSLLEKGISRAEFGNSSASLIDNAGQNKENKEIKK